MKKNLRLRAEGLRALLGLLSAILCAALIYAGLALLTSAGVRWDFTAERLTTLSEGTLQALDNLEEPVSFHLIFASSTESVLRTELETLTQSYERSGKVVVDTIDPIAQPQRISPFMSSGQSIPEGSVIVSDIQDERFQIVNAREMYEYAMTTSGAYRRTGIAAEQKLTAALRQVSGGETVHVYFLTGHREAGVGNCSSLVSRLEAENYRAADFSLQGGEALQTNDVLLILSPTLDLTEQESAELNAWLDAGGRMLFACDATIDMDTLPRFAQLAARFSLAFEPGIVVEDERQASRWVSSPLYLMPEITDSMQLAADASGRVIVPGSRAVSGPAMPLSGHTYQPILTTSDQAYIKRTDSTAFVREPDDPVGEQHLATSVVHETDGGELRAVFMGTLYTLVDNSLLSSTTNLDLSMALVGFLAQREGEASVPVRAVGDTSMAIPSAATAFAILGGTLFLPVLAAITGAIVIVRRRRQ